MSTMADVKVAEDAMMKAQKALQTYSDKDTKDFDEEGRLIGEVRKAVDSYLATVSALDSK
jgi:hypothetical protein